MKKKSGFKTIILVMLSLMTIMAVKMLYNRQAVFFGTYAYGSGAVFYNFYLVMFFLFSIVGISAEKPWGWTLTQTNLSLLLFNFLISSVYLKQGFLYASTAVIMVMIVALFIERKEFYPERQ